MNTTGALRPVVHRGPWRLPHQTSTALSSIAQSRPRFFRRTSASSRSSMSRYLAANGQRKAALQANFATGNGPDEVDIPNDEPEGLSAAALFHRSLRKPPVQQKYEFAADSNDEPDDLSAEARFRRSLRQAPMKPKYEYASDFLKRIGKVLTFGCNAEQTVEAARLAQTVAQDWPTVQMSRGNAIVEPRFVHHDRIDRTSKTSDWEHGSESWGVIPRPFPIPIMAEKAAIKFLEYASYSARDDAKEKWQRLRKSALKSSKLDIHAGISKLPHPPIIIRSVTWPVVAKQRFVRAIQNVSAFTRLENFEELDGRIRFVLRVSIWSHRTFSLLAEAQVKMVCTSYGDPKWFLREMERLLNHESPDVKPIFEWMRTTLYRLERETWKRVDAAEDLGSAAPANQ